MSQPRPCKTVWFFYHVACCLFEIASDISVVHNRVLLLTDNFPHVTILHRCIHIRRQFRTVQCISVPPIFAKRKRPTKNVAMDSANPPTAISTAMSTVTLFQLLPPPYRRRPQRFRHVFRRNLSEQQPPCVDQFNHVSHLTYSHRQSVRLPQHLWSNSSISPLSHIP